MKFNRFHFYNTVWLSTIATTLHLRSSDLIVSWLPGRHLDQHLPVTPTSHRLVISFLLCFYEVDAPKASSKFACMLPLRSLLPAALDWCVSKRNSVLLAFSRRECASAFFNNVDHSTISETSFSFFIVHFIDSIACFLIEASHFSFLSLLSFL